MNEKKLIIELTKTDTGVSMMVKGCQEVEWAPYLERMTPKAIECLKKQWADSGKPATGSLEGAIAALAEVAEKPVEEIEKELSKMKGSEKENLTKLAIKYMTEALKKTCKKG